MTLGSVAKGVLIAVGSFVFLGTVAALWQNPFFIRMTPTSGFEIGLLALQAILLGVYISIPVPACAVKLANYVGIACPICNKLLLALFGASTLLTYLEPVRIYFAVGGVLLMSIATTVRWRKGRSLIGNSVLLAVGS